ncbi:hypothetical protein [Nocardia callitridis]|uniref:Uncharacterized protein n=1 Tax=Nocardia callitridis TaxID=648753 RepID=A0ABP9K0Y7_9NOCA
MSYSQYSGGYQPYPVYSGGAQGAPGGGTAITAGVLASIGAVAELLGGVVNVVLAVGLGALLGSESAEIGGNWYTLFVLVTGVVAIVAGILLGWGAIALFNKKALGRTLIVVGCLLVIVAALVSFALSQMVADSLSGVGLLAGGIISGVVLVFPIATLILVLLSSTSRWLSYRPELGGQPYPGPSGYPQPQGYPPPGAQQAPSQWGVAGPQQQWGVAGSPPQPGAGQQPGQPVRPGFAQQGAPWPATPEPSAPQPNWNQPPVAPETVIATPGSSSSGPPNGTNGLLSKAPNLGDGGQVGPTDQTVWRRPPENG